MLDSALWANKRQKLCAGRLELSGPSASGHARLPGVHWDDLEILRGIDRIEQTETAYLQNGLWLMEKIAGGQVPEHQRILGFVHELILAAQSGYLEFEDSQAGW